MNLSRREFVALGAPAILSAVSPSNPLLDPEQFRRHIEFFNRMVPEEPVTSIPNAQAWEWMRFNIPFFSCPDEAIEQIYYYRWWTFRKAIKSTPAGYIVTEFLKPVNHAGEYNALSCALGHHIAEGRWLRERSYVDQDIHYWLRGGAGGGLAKNLHQFTGWVASSVADLLDVRGDVPAAAAYLDALDADYSRWEEERLTPSGLFWQRDVSDGMEESASGGRRVKNIRPSINSCMYGNAAALARIAALAGKADLESKYRAKAVTLRRLVQQKLWNPEARFFETLDEQGALVPVREAIGFTPWYFCLPEKGRGRGPFGVHRRTTHRAANVDRPVDCNPALACIRPPITYYGGRKRKCEIHFSATSELKRDLYKNSSKIYTRNKVFWYQYESTQPRRSPRVCRSDISRENSMKKLHLFLALILGVSSAFAQSDRGTITGTVTDASGAIVPAAKVNLANKETGSQYDTVTTTTGNYTLAALPVGNYKLAVEQTGFSKSEVANVTVQVAVTTRVDVVLQIGASSQSIQVEAESTLLKTESAEQSTTVTGAQINALPVNFGIGAGAIRNPLSFTSMTPGATINGWNNVTVNGTNGGFKILFEGQESNSSLDPRVSDESQPSVEAVQEFTLQTSNFAPEFGAVTGGLYNFTSRSGTNDFHGSAYTYIQNTAFNAGLPFTDDGKGRHKEIVKHLADTGFSVGGPVILPKYNGKNKTFFFFNWEHYRDRESLYNGITTVPNSDFRNGDLSGILTGRNLGTDFAGRPIFQNQIYDPATATLDSSGRRVLQPFANNIIPTSRFDPVSVKIMQQIPNPNLGNSLVNNFSAGGPFYKLQTIPSIKIDHSFSTNTKISGYYSWENTLKSNGVDGLPEPVSQVRIQDIKSKTFRLNYDQSLTPTLLLHLGAGVQRYNNPDTVPPESANYDNRQLGILNAPGTGFPRFGGGSLGNNTYGGMALAMGPGNRGRYYDLKPTAVAQLAWVHGNHTYKVGGEWKIDSFINISDIGLSPAYGFSGAQTSQPLYGQTLPSGTGIGYNWASFLLGLYDNVSIGDSVNPQYRRAAWGFFVQDTWKLTRNITLDYGLRYDLQQPMREEWRRTSGFNPNIANPNANGRLGGIIYDGYGAGRCNCDLVPTYKLALAPRLGIAWRVNNKTVARAGWGLSYGSTAFFNYIGGGNSQGMGFNTVSVPSPGNGVAAGRISDPLVYDNAALYGASYNPGLLVNPGAAVQGAPAVPDPNGGRPPRTNQWNITIQREINKDLSIEASYIGNHAVWLQSGGNLVNYNTLSPADLAARGLDITNAATRTLLTSTITSSLAVAAGYKKPYANFPDSGTVLQSLKPFPQYNGIGSLWAPLGSSWYNAFQMKLTKRFSHGLTGLVSYAHSKTLDSFSGNGNIFDRSSFKGLSPNDRPNILSISADYTTPTVGFLKSNRFARTALAGWTIGAILQYQSAPLLQAPASNNSLGTYLPGSSTRQFRDPNQPLYLKDLNCGCIDPTQETVLNPAAWIDQAAGFWGSGTVYYNDFRGQRRPVESISLGKRFAIRERMSFAIRAEFFNPFNRNEVVSDPSTGSPSNPATRTNGLLTGGFGYMNYTAISSNAVGGTLPAPRTGQIVARFEF